MASRSNPTPDNRQGLSDTISPRLTLWRYDPIVLSDAIPAEYTSEPSSRLQARFTAPLIVAISPSFLDNYEKTRRNLARIENLHLEEPASEQWSKLTPQLTAIAAARGIAIFALM